MTRARRPLIADPKLATAAAAGCLVLFWALLRDHEQPKWIRWATWW